MKVISVLNEEKIVLNSATKFFGKVPCYSQAVPFRARIELHKRIGNASIYFSLTSERPHKMNNEKVVVLKKGENYPFFTGGQEKEPLFLKNFVYITIESEKEAVVYFECSFGKCKIKYSISISK